MSILKRITRLAAMVTALAVPGLAYAQSCALCYTQAAGSGSRMIAALRSGILILMLPPMVICLGITWMAYKKRNQFNEYEDEGGVELQEPQAPEADAIGSDVDYSIPSPEREQCPI